ncbi:hypothetical protein K2Z83_20645 [Oscillochloris sp. ZM17-4]|uniref:hypothetical protein n=1 Tax=Oscillochloris sp. ZM17-4 TaxID=2866714 RepID=UPI001C72BCFD|nr:hypothetical protein [Oscillochloris sp. ZM17-4]MBX0330080.1 hypothetical protein [Oscillochloris sp. ZM17-4]
MSDFYEKQRATVNIGMALQGRGWNLIGFHADQSDSQTDYYHPASWDGIATNDAYPGVVVAVNVNDYSVKNTSGKHTYKVSTVPGDACPKCNGSGVHADGLTYTEALERPEDSHVAIRDRARGFRFVVIGISGAPRKIDPSDFHEDGRPKCLACNGRGHQLKEVKEIIFTYPTFRANPRGRAWHVEHDGRQIASGTGFSKCADYGTRSQQASAAVADEIEAAAKRTLRPAAPTTDTAATPTQAQGQLATVATAGGITVHAEHDEVKSWTYLKLTPRVERAQYDGLAARFNVKWHRMRRQPVIYRLIGADEVAAFFGPVAGQEPAPAPVEATPAPEPVYAEAVLCIASALSNRQATPPHEPAPEIEPGDEVYILAPTLADLGGYRDQIVEVVNRYAIVHTFAAEAKSTLQALLRLGANASDQIHRTIDDARNAAQEAPSPLPAGYTDEEKEIAFVERFNAADWGGEALAEAARNARYALLEQVGWVMMQSSQYETGRHDSLPRIFLLKATIPGGFRATELVTDVTPGYIAPNVMPAGSHLRYLLVRKGAGESYRDIDSGATDIALRDDYAVLTVLARLALSLRDTIRSGMAHLSNRIYDTIEEADADAPNHLIAPAPPAPPTPPRAAYFTEVFTHNAWGGRPLSAKAAEQRQNELGKKGWHTRITFIPRGGYTLFATNPTRHQEVPLVLDNNSSREKDAHGNRVSFYPSPNGGPDQYFDAWVITLEPAPEPVEEAAVAPKQLAATPAPTPEPVEEAAPVAVLHPDAPGQGRTHFYEEFYDADWGSTPSARKAAEQRQAELTALGWRAKTRRDTQSARYSVSAFDPSVQVYTSRVSLDGLTGETSDGEGFKMFTRITPNTKAAAAMAPAPPAPEPTPVKELHPLTRIVRMRAEVARLKAAAPPRAYEKAHKELVDFQLLHLAKQGIPLAISEMYQSRPWAGGALAKRARDLRARALRNAGWIVTTSDGAAAFLAAENPLYDGAPVKRAIVDVTPDSLSQQYQPTSLATPDSDETPRPMAAPSIVITAAPEAPATPAVATAAPEAPAPVVVPEPTAAPVATKGKGKKASSAGPMQQLAMF